MDIRKLLNVNRNCNCGKIHSCDIKDVIVEKGALNQLTNLTQMYHNILLVADQNTYAICGKESQMLLRNKVVDVLVYEGYDILVPNEEAIQKLTDNVTDKTDLIIGIGSGVLNDLCKYVSFTKKLPYFIIATAPSMDGYASNAAAMIIENMKITYEAHVPSVIIADVDILKNAPIELIKSGYGDIIGKYSALNDWKLSRIVKNEYFCEYVYDLTYQMVKSTEELGCRLLERDEYSIKTLMEALIIVGIAMSYVGNSRPASGSEHHLSHYFEVVGLLNHEPYFLHGIDVAYSTIITTKLRKELLKIVIPKQITEFSKNKWKEEIHTIYSEAGPGIINLQNSLGWYEDPNKMKIYTDHWKEIRKVLSETPDSEDIIKILDQVKLSYDDFEFLYGEEKIKDGIWYAKDLKNRYTVLWMYYDLFYGSKSLSL
ncbi:sn-glycerol-1-phosphate dehydrogenase [Anaerocolumna aminovalerica]|uniref:sn-glycerol-1-phosphate dehydrogenase n=1 Tax=Anaerocolumna aminovalerica TaxID=1527 RepID=UPI00248CF60C|nr:sn-glycerol-1-phosphate dehydrogenase [Anaerocolumna aminovalerica]